MDVDGKRALTTTVDPNPGLDHGTLGGCIVAKKNGNGEGSRPRQRADGPWEARYCIETPDVLKRRSVYGKTRKERLMAYSRTT